MSSRRASLIEETLALIEYDWLCDETGSGGCELPMPNGLAWAGSGDREDRVASEALLLAWKDAWPLCAGEDLADGVRPGAAGGDSVESTRLQST